MNQHHTEVVGKGRGQEVPVVGAVQVPHLRGGRDHVQVDQASGLVHRQGVRLGREHQADAAVAGAAVQLEHLPSEAELRLDQWLAAVSKAAAAAAATTAAARCAASQQSWRCHQAGWRVRQAAALVAVVHHLWGGEKVLEVVVVLPLLLYCYCCYCCSDVETTYYSFVATVNTKKINCKYCCIQLFLRNECPPTSKSRSVGCSVSNRCLSPATRRRSEMRFIVIRPMGSSCPAREKKGRKECLLYTVVCRM